MSIKEILDLEQLEVRLFRGRTIWSDIPRLFGGEVAGQALVAAGRTVPSDRHVHSLHAYFLLPGDPRRPVLYEVDAIRDGGSFTTRRVVAVQNGEAIFHLSASFHAKETGVEHQLPAPEVTAPDDLPSAQESLAAADEHTLAWFARMRERIPVEFRFPEELPRLATMRGEVRPPQQRVWLRSSQPLGDDPLVHVCAVTYVSDLFLLATALPPHGVVVGDESLQLASLDHAVWFHAPFRADEWLYYDMESTWAARGRALCRGMLFDQQGRLIASVVQEGMTRIAR